MEFVERFFEIPKRSFFLFGPRGTGKSTLLRKRFPQALWIDLLRPDEFRRYSARPERLREAVLGNPDKSVVVIDEIQRVPELLSVIHGLIESKLGRRFVMTGSSSRKLKRAGVNLLAGRALYRSLHSFMAAELPTFHLESALQFGLLPLVAASEDSSDVLKAYVSLYLREEVQLEGLVRNIGNFARFLEVLSFSHASVLNVSNVARECAVERKTVAGYIEVTEDLLLCFRVPVFSKRAKRQTAVHPKFYLFDSGVYRSLRPQGPLDRPEEVYGCALEGLVAQHLRAWIAYKDTDLRLYYWRTRSGVEVDFIVYGTEEFWALEVKNTNSLRRQHLRPLRSFKADYPECRALYLYRGTERLMVDDILCVPCQEFLLQLRPSQVLYEGL